MKTHLLFLVAVISAAGIVSVAAQPRGGGAMMGGGAGAVNLSGATAKLFGQNTNFSANIEMQVKPATGNAISVPGKISQSGGNSRMEVDITKSTGASMPPQALAQMKTMGMDLMVTISRPDKKVIYIIYPNMKAYVETATPDADPAKADQFKIETTELGKETVDGHDCVKNKVVVTDDKGNPHESTVWNASDLKKFPVKLTQTENGNATTMVFKDIKLGPNGADSFDPPAGFTKYDSVQAMMMQEMMKRRGGG